MGYRRASVTAKQRFRWDDSGSAMQATRSPVTEFTRRGKGNVPVEVDDIRLNTPPLPPGSPPHRFNFLMDSGANRSFAERVEPGRQDPAGVWIWTLNVPGGTREEPPNVFSDRNIRCLRSVLPRDAN
jgi:hypothetical protein